MKFIQMSIPVSVLALIISFCPYVMSENRKINGKVIVSSYMNPLAAITGATFTGSGFFEKDVIDLLSATLNFTYEVHPPRDLLGVGSISNGTGNGALGQILRKEVDLFAGGAETGIDKVPYMDATYPVVFDLIKIITNYPKIGSKSDALVAIYSKTVWICILASTATIAIALNYLIKSNEPVSEPISVLIFGVVASQGGYFRYRSLSSRLIWSAWCLSLVILVNVYTGTLTSFLSAPNYQFVANSLEDVAKNPSIQPFVVQKSAVEDAIKKCPLHTCQIIKARWDSRKDLLFKPSIDLVKLLTEDENNVIVISELVGNALVNADYRTQKRCRLTLAKIPVYTRSAVILLQKGSPYLAAINKQIMLFHEHGLFKHLQMKHSPDPKVCYVAEKRTQAKPSVLTVAQLKDSFILLLAGMVASFTMFMLSLIFGRSRLRSISI